MVEVWALILLFQDLGTFLSHWVIFNSFKKSRLKINWKILSTYVKVATTLVVGQPSTKLVSADLLSSVTSSRELRLSHSSDTRTLSFSLKLPPVRALAISSRSLNKNRCRSWLCTPYNKQTNVAMCVRLSLI